MQLTLAHARAHLLQLARYPTFVVPTLVLPATFFLLFGLPQARERPAVLAASFSAYAVLSVAFFQFGVGIAADREDPWEAYLRTLPVGVGVRLAGRIASAIVFAAAATGLLLAVVLLLTPPSLSATEWLAFVAALFLGAVPLALLGIALGYWIPPKGALPVANLLYLGLAYAGGLWTGPNRLPGPVETLAPYLPTRQWGDVLWASVAGGGFGGRHWLVLLGFAVVFGGLAAWGYRRDEGERFR